MDERPLCRSKRPDDVSWEWPLMAAGFNPSLASNSRRMTAAEFNECVLAALNRRWTQQHIFGGFQTTASIHSCQSLGGSSAEVAMAEIDRESRLTSAPKRRFHKTAERAEACPADQAKAEFEERFVNVSATRSVGFGPVFRPPQPRESRSNTRSRARSRFCPSLATLPEALRAIDPTRRLVANRVAFASN